MKIGCPLLSAVEDDERFAKISLVYQILAHTLSLRERSQYAQGLED